MNFPDHSIPGLYATARSYNPGDASPQRRFGLFPGRSPLLGESFSYFLLLEVLRCFSSLRSPPYNNVRMTVLQTDGLSHSEIAGSMDICSYPALIAAYHVLHRLREPRHPPCALLLFLRLRTPQCHKAMRRRSPILSAVFFLFHVYDGQVSFSLIPEGNQGKVLSSYYSLDCVNMSKS